MQTRHPMNGPPHHRQQPPQSYAGIQNGRQPIPYSVPLAPGQVVPRHPPQRGPPRPGMFPSAEPAFRNLQPGDIVRARSAPTEDAGRAGVGAGMGMGMAPRPYMPSVESTLTIGRGIDEAGYPVLAGGHGQPGGQGQQQVYRMVPGMGQSGSGGQQPVMENPSIGNQMNQLSLSAPPAQPNSRPHLAQPPFNNRPPISSQASLQPSRNPSHGGSISSIQSSSTTRTASSSNESALNLRQHYLADPANIATNGQPRTANGVGQVGQNPLLDLLSSEREYAEQMTCIVRVSP
jgi:hypothetical protein